MTPKEMPRLRQWGNQSPADSDRFHAAGEYPVTRQPFSYQFEPKWQMGQLQQRHHDDGGSPSPLQFPFPLQLDPYFLHRFSPGLYHGEWRWCRPYVGHVLVRLRVPEAAISKKTCHWKNPSGYVEDDEEMIEKARYLRPVAGRATTCRKAKCLFSVPPARGSSSAEFCADAKNQDDSPCGLQLDAEFSNPNPGSEALHGGQAGPEAHRFTA